MTKALISAGLLAAGLLLTGAAQAATVSYTFDTGAQGWSYGDINASTVNIVAAAPWDSGSLHVLDQAGETGVYAPTEVLGNQDSAYGGTITWDVGDLRNDNANYTAIVLYGLPGVAVTAGRVLPTTVGLTTFSVTLTEANFVNFTGGFVPGSSPVSGATFHAILSNLSGIAFRTEWATGADDSRFDNAVFEGFTVPGAGGGAVPEPASWALMIAGFGLAGATLRRRRTRLA